MAWGRFASCGGGAGLQPAQYAVGQVPNLPHENLPHEEGSAVALRTCAMAKSPRHACEQPDVAVVTRPESERETRTRRVPPYNVVLDNDDHHTFEFVVGVLSKALGYSAERSFQLTLQAHTSGRAVVWTGPREVAELKADQIRTFHEVGAGNRQLGPLGVCVEPAPG